ncbi:hypothetical protein GCM10018987_34610 [Streptomyces cremeus]
MAPEEAGKRPFAVAGCEWVGGGAGKWSGLLAACRRVGGVSAMGDGCVRLMPPVGVRRLEWGCRSGFRGCGTP